MPQPRPRYRAGARTYAFEHRAFARLDHRARTLLGAAVLAVVAAALWVGALPFVARLWGHGLVAMAGLLGLGDVTVMRIHDVWGWAVAVPHWELSASVPGVPLLFGVGFGTLVLFLALSLLPERWRPGVYLMRAVLLVQASAVVYFAVWPELFPYTLSDYLHGMMATGLAIATAVPVVAGLTLYVQDLSLAQKAAFTALALGYSVVLVPLQYALQGLAISGGTLLWMPALYLFLGVPLHVLALVALYAWAMSWPGRLPALGVPADAPQPAPGRTPRVSASLPSRPPPIPMPTISMPSAARWLSVAVLLLLGATSASAQSDLTMDKVADAATVDVGDTVVFTLTVANTSNTNVDNIVASDVLPAAFTFVGASGAGTYTSGTGVWTIGQIRKNKTAVLTITTTANAVGTFTNTASITGSDTSDPNPGNDSDGATVTIRTPLTPQPGVCYAVADAGGANGGDDWLIITTRDGSQQGTIGTGTGTNLIEASAYWPGTDELYAANASTLGTLDLTTGEYNSIGAFGTADGVLGTVTIDDVDGLAFDPFTGWLYGSHRREGTTPNPEDLLVRIDPATGLIVPDAFGAGVDYVVIASAPVGERDIDDIAIDSEDGTLYAIANGGTADRLIIIDKLTGAVTDVGPLGQDDMEGFAFDAFGTLFGSTGSVPASNPNALFSVDKASAVASLEAAFDDGSDHESVACLTDGVNDLSGTLFYDTDANGAYAAATDTPLAGRSVTLYRDVDGSGTLTAGDIALATQATDGAGAYGWTIAAEGDFVVVSEDLTASGGAWTTPTAYAPTFAGFGNAATGLDFGYTTVADLSVGIAVDDAAPPLGSDVTFTVTLTNDGPTAATGAVVSAPLPAGYTFVSSDGGTAYDDATGVWTVPGTLASGASTTLDVVATTGTTASRTMTAEVAAADQPDVDSTPGNGVAAEDDQASVSVVGQPTDLALAMGVSDPAPTVGDVVTFTLTLTNESGTDATGVQVSAPFVARADTVVVVGATPSVGSYDGTLWTVGPLAAGQTVTLAVQVRLDQDLIAFTALAEVASTDQPDTDSTPYNGVTSEDDYASATATTGGASTAGEGGLESNGSMAQALAAVLYGRRVEAADRVEQGLPAPTPLALRASPLAMRGAGLAVPRVGPAGSLPVEVSPTDLLPVTNAIDVVAADYIRADGRRVGAAFVTQTAAGEVYEHTKPVCDRLRGGTLDGVEVVAVAGHPFVLTRLTQADGSVDYAISFVVYETAGARTVDSRFLLHEYDTAAMTGEVLNVQVWGPSREYAATLAAGALAELAGADGLAFRTKTDAPAVPAVFVRSGRYADGRLVLDLHNAAGATSLTLTGGTLTRAEGARPETFSQTVEVPAGSADAPAVTVAVETGYLFDAAFFVTTDQSTAPDRLYLADGTWGVALDPDSDAARLDRFSVVAETGDALAGARRVERAVTVRGRTDSWATVYRTLAPGGQTVDLSDYRYVEFEAAGSGEVHVLLQQAAIATSDHFGATVRLAPEGGRHRIWFSDLHLADGSRGFDGAGVVTLSLTARTADAAPFEIAVSDVRFGGTADDAAAVSGELALLNPAPNPFASATRLRFDLDEAGPVMLRVFDVLGREVTRPIDGPLPAGRHEATFGAAGLAAGVYIVRLDTNGRTLTRRMTLIR